MRTLIFFHIRHVAEELGACPDTTDTKILDLWERIREEVEALPVPHKVYNDSYSKFRDEGPIEMTNPNSFIEADLMFQPKGPNKDILIWLFKKGSTIVWCESNELLERYLVLMETIRHKYSPDEKLSDCELASYCEIIGARNEFIAKQIGHSLQDSETGMLFLGRSHDLGDHMTGLLTDLDIDVIHHFKNCLPGE
jgi:hypothetical protein